MPEKISSYPSKAAVPYGDLINGIIMYVLAGRERKKGTFVGAIFRGRNRDLALTVIEEVNRRLLNQHRLVGNTIDLSSDGTITMEELQRRLTIPGNGKYHLVYDPSGVLKVNEYTGYLVDIDGCIKERKGVKDVKSNS